MRRTPKASFTGTSSRPIFLSPSVSTPRFWISAWPRSRPAVLPAKFIGEHNDEIDDQHLTSPGSTLGTIAYMSPEQARGKELDARSDLFSFGAVLYEMVTGALPFQTGSSAEIFKAILDAAPVSAVRLNPRVPIELERIINKALEKDRNLRYQSAAEMRADLQRLKRDTDSSRSAVLSRQRVRELHPSVRDQRFKSGHQNRPARGWKLWAAGFGVVSSRRCGDHLLQSRPLPSAQSVGLCSGHSRRKSKVFFSGRTARGSTFKNISATGRSPKLPVLAGKWLPCRRPRRQ